MSDNPSGRTPVLFDTLDPPPLGTVDLKEAKRLLTGKTFIKGNIDPVNTLLNGTPEEITNISASYTGQFLRKILAAHPVGERD